MSNKSLPWWNMVVAAGWSGSSLTFHNYAFQCDGLSEKSTSARNLYGYLHLFTLLNLKTFVFRCMRFSMLSNSLLFQSHLLLLYAWMFTSCSLGNSNWMVNKTPWISLSHVQCLRNSSIPTLFWMSLPAVVCIIHPAELLHMTQQLILPLFPCSQQSLRV